MKSLIAKTLTSTALALATFTPAHAFSDNNGPWPTVSEENPRWFSPAQIRYFEQREAAIAKELKDRPVKSDYRTHTGNVTQETAMEWMQRQSQSSTD